MLYFTRYVLLLSLMVFCTFLPRTSYGMALQSYTLTFYMFEKGKQGVKTRPEHTLLSKMEDVTLHFTRPYYSVD